MARIAVLRSFVAAGLVSIACGDSGGGGTTSGGTGAGETSFGTSTGAGFDGTEESTGSAVDDGMGAECSIWEQDCPEGDKCVPWSDQPDLVPDEIRCCPEEANAKQPGDQCVVDDYFGSCLDNCEEGSMCFDIDNDGMGTCQKFCDGTPDVPTCELDESCFIYFAGVPFCFRKCDPLVQGCPTGEGCYPDADIAGGTGFICLPVIGNGGVGDVCWLLSNCAPGLLCVTPDFLPDCDAPVGCCTELCDITQPDTCGDINPDIECVSWYFGGQTPPDVNLANVGACSLPQ